MLRAVRTFLADLWRIVIFQPVREGTLSLKGHSRGVAGIVLGVTALYVLTVASILFANPIRSASSLRTSVNATGFVAVPSLLLPAVLCLLGIAFGLLLAGSQQAPWWRRILYLAVVWGALISVVGICVGLGASRSLAITSVVLAFVVLAYCIVMWFGRTAPAWDAVVLVVLTSGILLAAYRSLVLQALLGTESGELITVSFILTQVASLALPGAFLSGVNATAFGVSIVSWSGDDIGRRAVWWFVGAIVVFVLGWQWISFGMGVGSGLDAVGSLAREGVAAFVLLSACTLVWLSVRRRRASSEDSSPVDVAAACVGVAIPVAYGVTSSAFIAALLSALVASLNTVVPEQVIAQISALLDLVASNAFITTTRVLVVAGLAVATLVLLRRGSHLIAAIAGVNALVVATTFWGGQIAPDWPWTPSSLGNIGLIYATFLGLWWTARRSWDRDRAAFILVLCLLSALVRQADFFAVPLGFVIGASAAALLIVGLIWGFLTEGGEAHEDSPRYPKDRQMLVLLGSFLFAITVVGWAVIGKDVGTSLLLSAAATQGLQMLGSAMIVVVVLASASPWMSRPGKEADARSSAVPSHGVQD